MASYHYGIAFSLGLSITVLLAIITETLRVKFSKTISHHKLTLKPYYMTSAYIFLSTICVSVFLHKIETGDKPRVTFKNQFTILVVNLFESTIVLFQVLEWFLYAFLVNYQAKQQVDQLAIKRDEFYRLEKRAFKWYVAFWTVYLLLEFIPFLQQCARIGTETY